MLKAGDILKGTVLEVKEDSAIIKFGTRAIEAELLAELEIGEKIKVKVKGWYDGRLLLKVLKKEARISKNFIDIKV